MSQSYQEMVISNILRQSQQHRGKSTSLLRNQKCALSSELFNQQKKPPSTAIKTNRVATLEPVQAIAAVASEVVTPSQKEYQQKERP